MVGWFLGHSLKDSKGMSFSHFMSLHLFWKADVSKICHMEPYILVLRTSWPESLKELGSVRIWGNKVQTLDCLPQIDSLWLPHGF